MGYDVLSGWPPTLGLRRVGARYNQRVIKVDAIFSIIPVLNIAEPMLVLIG